MSKGNGTTVKNGAGKRSVTLYPSRRAVEIQPGVKITGLPREHVPELAIVRWQAVGDGTYRPIVKIYDARLRATEAVKVLHVPYRTLLRLWRAGFVKGEQIAPNNIQIDLASYFDHQEKVQADPDFWNKPANKRKYHDAL